jgi:hypothetical protein
MNPYLEQEVLWHDFHKRFLPAAPAHLTAQLLPRYIVLIDENVYLHDLTEAIPRPVGRPDLSVAPRSSRGQSASATGLLEAPAHVLLPDYDVESDSFLEIRDRQGRQLVTVVELLSPTNKRQGSHRSQYLLKRLSLLNSNVHLVEIDLLRGGLPMPFADRPPGVYSVLVSRADTRPRADFWPFGLRDPLPTVPIPLRPDDGDATLHLRSLLNRIYDESGYPHFLYDPAPAPPWKEKMKPGREVSSHRSRGQPTGSFLRSSQLFPHYKLEPRPNVRHRADLDVDKTKRQRHLANRIFGDVGRDLRALLWP